MLLPSPASNVNPLFSLLKAKVQVEPSHWCPPPLAVGLPKLTYICVLLHTKPPTALHLSSSPQKSRAKRQEPLGHIPQKRGDKSSVKSSVWWGLCLKHGRKFPSSDLCLPSPHLSFIVTGMRLSRLLSIATRCALGKDQDLSVRC